MKTTNDDETSIGSFFERLRKNFPFPVEIVILTLTMKKGGLN